MAMAVGVGASVGVGTDVRVGLKVGTAVCANVPVAEGSVPAVGMAGGGAQAATAADTSSRVRMVLNLTARAIGDR